jgi:DegV family protein with EDD domain
MNIADKAHIAIVTDSIADIPPEVAESLKITVVPAILTLEGNTYLNGKDLSRDEFYRRMPDLRDPPTTAAPSPIAFEQAYQQLFDSGIERILSIHVAGNFSGMLNSVQQAAQNFGDRVQVFDSHQLSLAQGFQVIEAAITALAGKPFQMVLETAQLARENVQLIAMMDTFEYLKRSGRVSWLRAGMGELLDLKLLVSVIHGVVERIGVTRTRRKAVDQLLNLAGSWRPLKRLAVLHSALPEEATALSDRIQQWSIHPPLVVDVNTAIGVHVGPRAIGLAGLRT